MHGTYENFAVERIVYGRPAAAVLGEEAARIGARRVFLLVSRTLDRETGWVARCAPRWGTAMPAPMTACRRTRRATQCWTRRQPHATPAPT